MAFSFKEVIDLPWILAETFFCVHRLRINMHQAFRTATRHDDQVGHIADNIIHFRALLGKNVDRLSFEDRQAVVHLLVEKVVGHLDGAVDVHHVLPFEEQPGEHGKR